MDLILLAILGTFFIIIFNFYKYVTFWRHVNSFPGPRSYPFIGNAHQVGLNSVDCLSNMMLFWKNYGCNAYRLWIGNSPFVILSNPKDIEVILSMTPPTPKADEYKFLYPWLGEGLLISNGNKWFKRRKMITPSFHFSILLDFFDTMNTISDTFVQKLNEKAETGEVFDIQSMVYLCTLDIICATSMGTNLDSINNPKSDVVSAFQDMCHVINHRIFSAVEHSDFLFRFTSNYHKQKNALAILKEFISKVIEEGREILMDRSVSEEEGNKAKKLYVTRKKKAFLDNLLTSTIDGQPLTFQEIFEEVSTFIFEGHDTTTSAITFAIHVMSRHPDIQEKVLEEQRTILGDDFERSPTFQDVTNMKYLEMVIKETLRLYPSVPFIGRRISKGMDLNGKYVPPNTNLTAFLFAMGYNEKYFPDAHKVDPERFLPERCDKSNPFNYVPFSAGPRNCIGQKFAMLELKSVLSKVVRYFEILPPASDLPPCSGFNWNFKETANPYDPELATALILKANKGVYIKLRRRNL